MNKYLVTVYLTNHNYGKYVSKAIQSVLDQTFLDFELIIIDDGSTDNSRNVIEKFANISNIEIIYQTNKGLNISNNIALKLARGKYIVRLDADDFWSEDFLSKLVSLIEEDNDVAIVFSDYYIVNQDDDVLNIVKRDLFETSIPVLDLPAHGACTLIRTDYLRGAGGYNEDFSCQDGYDLWLKMIGKYKFKHIKIPLFYYRQHSSNLTKNESRLLKTRINIKEKYDYQIDEGKTICIIPIRDFKMGADELALKCVNGKELLFWILDAVLLSKLINLIVVTSSNTELKSRINENDKYRDKVKFHLREETKTRYNVELSQIVEDVLNSLYIDSLYNTILITTIRFPFLTSDIIDDAIRSLKLFNTDSLIGVRNDNNRYYKHDGSGLKLISIPDQFTLLESEQVYRQTGGISVTNINYFNNQKKLIGGKVGHVIIPAEVDHIINTYYDLQVASLIAKEGLNRF